MVLIIASVLAAAGPAATGAGVSDADLLGLAATPAPSGYEGDLRSEIRKALPEGLSCRVDNLGSLIVEGGEGSPHRLFLTPMDEPGLVVSGITSEGYLRLHPLGGIGRGGMDPRFLEGKRVLVRGGDGWLPGAVVSTSIHLRGRRPETFALKDLWVDVGAASPKEVEEAGITPLSPVVLGRRFERLARGRVAGVSLSHRFGCSLLLEVARRWARSPPGGKWTIAWTAQELPGGRGSRRVARQIDADEVYYVGRFPPSREGAGASLGEGPLLMEIEGDFPGGQPVQPVQKLPRARWDLAPSGGSAARRHALSVPVLYGDTPGEVLDSRDMGTLMEILLSLGKGEDR